LPHRLSCREEEWNHDGDVVGVLQPSGGIIGSWNCKAWSLRSSFLWPLAFSVISDHYAFSVVDVNSDGSGVGWTTVIFWRGFFLDLSFRS
jgi:hypothetical protein